TCPALNRKNSANRPASSSTSASTSTCPCCVDRSARMRTATLRSAVVRVVVVEALTRVRVRRSRGRVRLRVGDGRGRGLPGYLERETRGLIADRLAEQRIDADRRDGDQRDDDDVLGHPLAALAARTGVGGGRRMPGAVSRARSKKRSTRYRPVHRTPEFAVRPGRRTRWFVECRAKKRPARSPPSYERKAASFRPTSSTP